jgi:hypothetical protein
MYVCINTVLSEIKSEIPGHASRERLKWAKHIKTKRKQLDLKAKQMHWLLGRSALSTESKLLLYKAVLKPIWTYGIQLWGTASNSNIVILSDPF